MGFVPLRKNYFWAKSHFMIDDHDEPENFYAFRGQWLDYLNTRHDLTHGDFRVAYFIASKINPDDKNMWWGVFSIADELPVSVATITSATDKLTEKGLLVVTRGRKGGYKYWMRMPIDPAGDAYAAEMKSKAARRKKTGGRKARVSKNETE